MRIALLLLFCSFFLFPSSVSADRKRGKKAVRTEIPAENPEEEAMEEAEEPFYLFPDQSVDSLAGDSLSEGDIVLPEGLLNGVDTLIVEENGHLQPPVERQGENTQYTDSIYIRRLSELPAVIELPYNWVVKQYIELYTEKRRELVEKLLALNQYYEPIFEEEIDKMGLPLELKYLPIIESALR
ncbi:MAG: hypothetical protein LUC18_05145, partial [Porphyromonadaceae bacterium]|nr:hypothetical protein [Porphyromonadaceae bacterium]